MVAMAVVMTGVYRGRDEGFFPCIRPWPCGLKEQNRGIPLPRIPAERGVVVFAGDVSFSRRRKKTAQQPAAFQPHVAEKSFECVRSVSDWLDHTSGRVHSFTVLRRLSKAGEISEFPPTLLRPCSFSAPLVDSENLRNPLCAPRARTGGGAMSCSLGIISFVSGAFSS